jgi:uncharacterized protein (TIGR03382 family)
MLLPRTTSADGHVDDRRRLGHMPAMLHAARPLFALVFLAAASAVGCGTTAPKDAPARRSSSPIVNGVLDTDQPAPLGDVDEAVVSISWSDATGNGFGCTGSLIGSRVVLTARHCVSDCEGNSTDPYYGCTTDYAVSGYQISLGWNTSTAYSPTSAHVTKIVHDSSTTIFDHDIALLELDQPIGTRVVPIRLNAPPIKGESVRAVGYGLTNDPSHLNTDFYPYRFRRDGISILGVGRDPSNDVGANELLLGESICDGDSGGPILDMATGAIVGTVSRGGNGTNYSDYRSCVTTGADVATNIYTRVDKFQALITQALADVGETPTAEGTPPPPDDAGTDATPADDTGAPGDDAGTDPSETGATTVINADAKASGGCSTSGSSVGAAMAFPFAFVAIAAMRRRASRR